MPRVAARPKRLILGFAEFVDIPDWRIRGLRAKIDTGARSSALHVENIQELGRDRVRFEVRLHRSKSDRRVHIEAAVVRRARVRSSSGVATTRVFVSTVVRIGPVAERIELGLVDREKMIYRMLLGRTALAPFLVDSAHRYLLTAPPLPRRAPARKARVSRQ